MARTRQTAEGIMGHLVHGKETILLIAPSDAVRHGLQVVLDQAGYRTLVSQTGARLPSEGWFQLPALIMIDRHSTAPAPLRQHQALRDLPIIAVYQPTPEYDEAATIRDLENGVDAVICTQNTRQLVAHVRAILRRQARQVSVAREYAIEGLHMNLDTHEVRVNGTPVELTPKEFRILRYFLEAPGRVLSRGEMLNRVWGEGHAIEEHALDLHIHRLRLKLEADPSCPKYLVTVRGIGFKLRVEL